jgi:hypothetical protein
MIRLAATRSSKASSESISIRPELALRMPMSRRNRVVLPAPLGPSSPQICPEGTEKETLRRAVLASKLLLTASTATSGGRIKIRRGQRRMNVAHTENRSDDGQVP